MMEQILLDLEASQIAFSIERDFDGDVHARLVIYDGGPTVHEQFDKLDAAVDWLREAVVEHLPESVFAEAYDPTSISLPDTKIDMR